MKAIAQLTASIRVLSSARLIGGIGIASIAAAPNRKLGLGLALRTAPCFSRHALPSAPRALTLVMNSMSARRPSDRSYRRQPAPEISELDLDEQVAQIDMDPKKLLQKDDPNTYQAVISDVMPVGYFLKLPTGRDAYLPADDLGFTGGLAILRRLFKEGQEITVRIVCRGGAGREIVSIKKPEFAPPSEQKTIEMMRLHFENEKKNRMNPRNRRHQHYNN